MRSRTWVVLLCVLLLATLAGCASTLSPRIAAYGQAGDEGDPGEIGDEASDEEALGEETVPSEDAATQQDAQRRCEFRCGLSCEDEEEDSDSFHIRSVTGVASVEGDDPGDTCTYLGFDVGRTHCESPCECWGVDAFYRTHSTRFSRLVTGGTTGRDEGRFHHLGLKAAYERSIQNHRVYWWVGAGPEYFWTEGYLNNDSGFGVFGEAGLGYVMSRHWRVRSGVNVHGLSTDAARLNPLNDGSSRWLWVVAAVVEIEARF